MGSLRQLVVDFRQFEVVNQHRRRHDGTSAELGAQAQQGEGGAVFEVVKSHAVVAGGEDVFERAGIEAAQTDAADQFLMPSV
jgi:hypothetical protein